MCYALCIFAALLITIIININSFEQQRDTECLKEAAWSAFACGHEFVFPV